MTNSLPEWCKPGAKMVERNYDRYLSTSIRTIHKVYKNGNIVFEKGGQQYSVYGDMARSTSPHNRFDRSCFVLLTDDNKAEIILQRNKDSLRNTFHKIGEFGRQSFVEGLDNDRLAKLKADASALLAALNEATS